MKSWQPPVNRIALSLLVLVSIDASSADLGFDRAKALADRDEAALTSSQMGALIQSQGTASGSSFAHCPQKSPHADLTAFTVVMELDAFGKVVRTWYQGHSSIGDCFRRQLSRATLFVPPKAPFYTSFEMSWQ